MISLKASRFRVSCEDYETRVFTRSADGYKDVTDSLNEDEKDELISDLIYCINELLNGKPN